jgi:hypothetical protein
MGYSFNYKGNQVSLHSCFFGQHYGFKHFISAKISLNNMLRIAIILHWGYDRSQYFGIIDLKVEIVKTKAFVLSILN